MNEEFRIKLPAGRSTHVRSLGWATSILASSKHRNRPVAYVEEVLAPAIRHEQIGFVVDQTGKEVGYFVWATLHPYTVEYIKQHRVYPSWESDWNELGESVLIDLISVTLLRKRLLAAIYKKIAMQGTAPQELHRIRNNFYLKKIKVLCLSER